LVSVISYQKVKRKVKEKYYKSIIESKWTFAGTFLYIISNCFHSKFSIRFRWKKYWNNYIYSKNKEPL